MPHQALKREDINKLLDRSLNPNVRGSQSYKDHGPETAQLMESLGREHLVDMLESFQDMGIKEAETALLEAGISESGFAFFTRAGVESVVQDGYRVDEGKLIADKCVMTVPSKRFQENYAWLFNPDMPQPLGDMEAPPETDIVPRSLTITNEDKGLALNISRRMIDDDQTGEFMNYASRVGRNHRIEEEIMWAGYLTGAAFSHSGVSVPAATYNDPDGTSGVYVTSGNRTNAITPAALSPDALQRLLDIMEGIQDPNGKLILPTMDTLVVGTAYRWYASHILNSDYWPGAQVTSVTTPGSVVGGMMGPNPLKPGQGVLNAAIVPMWEPHFNGVNDKKKWYVGNRKSRSLCRQERQPLEVLMEAPNAGESLRRRSLYHRTYRRYAYGWFDARYWGRGSDGTA